MSTRWRWLDVFVASAKGNFWPTLIELERHRRTDSHSSCYDGRSGRGRAPWSVGRRRKFVYRAKTAGARWPIYGERSTWNVLVSLNTWIHLLFHYDDVFKSRLYATTRVGNISSDGVSISTGRPGRLTSASPSSRKVPAERPLYGDIFPDGDGMRPRIGAHRTRQKWPSVFHSLNDRATKIQVNLLLIYRQ